MANVLTCPIQYYRCLAKVGVLWQLSSSNGFPQQTRIMVAGSDVPCICKLQYDEQVDESPALVLAT